MTSLTNLFRTNLRQQTNNSQFIL